MYTNARMVPRFCVLVACVCTQMRAWFLGFVDLGSVYVHKCAHGSSCLWTWVVCMYTNARMVPWFCGLGWCVCTQMRAWLLGFARNVCYALQRAMNLYSQHGLQLKSCVCARFCCAKLHVDECPSGLRSTPRKRVRVKSSASSNLASSAN